MVSAPGSSCARRCSPPVASSRGSASDRWQAPRQVPNCPDNPPPPCDSCPMGGGGRRLLVMRHAKAEAVAPTDHSRRLVHRGVRDAEEAGRWARSEGLLPDHVFVSTATRAVETWSAFREAAGLDVEAELDGGLYPAGPDGAIGLLRTAPADARTVMVVGHNPTMAQLV